MKLIRLSFVIVFLTSFALANDNVIFELNDNSLVQTALNDQLNNPQGYKKTTSVLRRFDIVIEGQTITKRIQEIWYYPDTPSVEDHGTETLHFDENNETVVVFTAASLNPDTSLHQIDSTTVQYGESDSYNTFSDAKVAYLPIPGLTAQSYSIIDYQVTTDYALEETSYYDSLWVETSFHHKLFQANIRWDDQELQWHGSHPDLNCEESERSLICEAKNVEPLDIDSSTLWRDKIRGLQISVSSDWEQVIQRMNESYSQAFLEQTLVDDLYDELTEGLKTNAEIIDVIHRYVSEQIRYVSLSTLGHSHTPHSNDSVIRNRYGDCKDKTALLHALLRKAGIEGVPRLVATYRTNADRLTLPSLAYFNHIILCIEEGSREYCLDPTDTTTHWQTTSDWIQDKVSLVLAEGEIPGNVPAAEYRWRMDVRTELAFTEEGALEEQQTRTFYGEYASFMRYKLRGEEEKDQLEMIKGQYQDNVANIDSVESFIESKEDDSYKRFTVGTSAYYEPFVPLNAHLDYSEDDAWLVSELGTESIENKFDDYQISGVKYKSRYIVDISSNWRAEKPAPSVALTTRFGGLVRQSYVDDNVLIIITTLNIPQQTIALEDQEDFNTFKQILNEMQLVRIEAPLKE
jgi:transglutaminase-like putative cysteine protease